MSHHAARHIPGLTRTQIAVVLVLLLWGALMVITQSWLIPLKSPPKSYDLYPRWYGARAVLWHGENPYTDDMARRISLDMGYPVDDSGYFVHRFYYPATIIWILLPFWLAPFSVSIVVWCSLQLLLLFTLPLLVYLVLEWRIQPVPLALVVFLSIFGWRHSFNAYLLGQFTIFTLGCLLLAWMALVAGRPWLVAVALICSALRGEGLVLTAVFLGYLLLTRRITILIIWGAIMAIMVALSLISTGFWLPDFLDGVRTYESMEDTTWPVAFVGGGGVVTVIVGAGIALWCGGLLYRMRALPDRTRVPWSLSVIFLAALLLLTQSKDYTLVYALLPIWVLLWAGRDQWWMLPLMLLMLLSPWVYWLAKADFGHNSLVEQFMTPLILLVLITYQWRRWEVAGGNIRPVAAAHFENADGLTVADPVAPAWRGAKDEH